jgi:hypothetical protein
MGEWATDRLDPATRVPGARDQPEQQAWERRRPRRPKPPDEPAEGSDQTTGDEPGAEAPPDHRIDDLA